jgi:two-component system chemotaxis response regulator CheB
VIGASAGGVEALKQLISELPAGFNAPVLVVLHIPAEVPSMLAHILDRVGPLPAHEALDGATIQPGHIYIAVPDHHLLVDGERMRVARGPKENRFRPAVDVLFRSAAYTRGPSCIGVVLTGQLDDGTAGLWAIKYRGGTTVVQRPSDALYPSMPSNALRYVQVDHIATLKEMPALLADLADEPVTQPIQSNGLELMRTETEVAAGGDAFKLGSLDLAHLSPFACPECHGVMSEMHEDNIVRFRCHTGHAYSMQSLLADIDKSVDDELWNAMRAIQERAMLLRRAEMIARERNNTDQAEALAKRASEAEEKAWSIRGMIQSANTSGSNMPPDVQVASDLGSGIE